jgi:hypothetical protein
MRSPQSARRAGRRCSRDALRERHVAGGARSLPRPGLGAASVRGVAAIRGHSALATRPALAIVAMPRDGPVRSKLDQSKPITRTPHPRQDPRDDQARGGPHGLKPSGFQRKLAEFRRATTAPVIGAFAGLFCRNSSNAVSLHTREVAGSSVAVPIKVPANRQLFLQSLRPLA